MAGERTGPAKPRWLMAAAIGATLLAGAIGTAPDFASAQGWQWPWEAEQAPRPREPMRRQFDPPPQGQQGQQGYDAPRQSTERGSICLQLEQRLAQEANRGANARTNVPDFEQTIRESARTIRSGESELDKLQCYEYFLFSKSLRRGDRRCVTLHNQVEQAKRSLAEMENRRQAAFSSGNRSHREEIIRELARHNCGDTYVREAGRISNPFSSIWQDEGAPSDSGIRFGELPFATYRTICVRLCDGYYFPVSFSTLPNHFERDAETCQSKCAAPSELYFHQNPGAGIDQAISHVTKQPYKSLKTAFKYRKEFVKGCSCKSEEFIPEGGQVSSPSTAPGTRAEGPAGAGAVSPHR